MKWLIPGPLPDETLESMVARAGVFYGCHSAEMWDELCSGLRPSPMEQPSVFALGRLARALGVAPKALLAHRMPAWFDLQPVGSRRAYCPECWAEDAAAGRPCALRRSWARALTLRCDVHRCPLIEFGRSDDAGRAAEAHYHANLWNGLAADLRDTLNAVSDFAQHLSTLLSAPTGNAGYRSRRCVLWMASNFRTMADFPPMASMPAPKGIELYLQVAHRFSPLRDDPWSSFVGIADPAIRRRALWAAREGLPGYVSAVFDDGPPSPRRQRLRRWAAAVDKSCDLRGNAR